MAYDEMELDTIGDRKTALFLIMSDTDSTFNFVIAILQSQLTNLLCDKADDVYGGRLPVHVRFILDEFANIGQIPQFDKLIATIRSREISASIILQSQSQLKAIYRDNADTIVGNCDTMLFLGGKEKTTLKEISEILGKETIDSFNTSENRGKEISHGLNYQKLGKELMTQDEIATMDGGMCILQLRGVRPFFSKKYDITKHPRYKYLSDADKKNTFDVERYIRVQRKKKKHPSAVIAPEEPFDLYEIELSDEDADFTAAEYLIMGNGTQAFAIAAEQREQENYMRTAELSTEQNYNMIDGQINNTPSVDELEEKAKRGEVISLSALAAAVKAEDSRTPQRDPDGKKPSIRAQLKADRVQSGKPQQREKEQETKRSIRQALEME